MSCHCVARNGQKQECDIGCPEGHTVPCRKDCTIVATKNRAHHSPDKSKFDEST